MRNRYFLVLDVAIVWLSAMVAFVLRFDLRFAAYRSEFLYFAIMAMAIKPATMYGAGVYRRYWQYASIPELIVLLISISASSMLMAMSLTVCLWANLLPAFSRSVVVIDWLLTVMMVGGVRVAARAVAESQRLAVARGARASVPKRALIVGAGAAGVMVARDLQRNPQLGLELVGFLDDDPKKIGHQIATVPVLGRLDALTSVAKVQKIEHIVIAMPTAPGSVVRSVVEQARASSLAALVIPGVFELVGGTVTVGRLREVQIADLLRRAHARPSFSAEQYIRDRTILVTGAGGSIGHELCRQVAPLGPKLLVMLGHGENSLFDSRSRVLKEFPDIAVLTVLADIRNEARLRRIFMSLRPDVVFHAAAHKHLPLLEDNPEEAMTNNAIGTRNVIRAALDAKTERLVMISTDKAAEPASMLGASKRLAEELVRQSATRFGRAFMVVRFGNVLGSRGSAVPIFKRQIAEGGPITITHPDMKRYFMTIPEAAHLVLEAGGLGLGGELFVLRMGEPIAIVDLARDLIRLSRADNDVPIVFTGARPGEKLEEVLWEHGAVIEETEHPDITCVRESSMANDVDWAAAIEHLTAVATRGSRAELIRELAEYLPTFVQGEPGAPAHA